MVLSNQLSFAKILLGSFIVVAACGLLALVTKLRSYPPAPPIINVNRAQFEEAMAKWRSMGIKEYEIMSIDSPTLGFDGGYSILRVSTGGPHVEVVHANDQFTAVRNEDEDQWLKFRTVEGLFAYAEELLSKQDNLAQEGKILKAGEMYYKTEFDQELGYPLFIEGHPYEGPDADGNFARISESDWKLRVGELTIIK